MLRQAGVESHIAVRAWQRHQIGISKMKLSSGPFAQKPRIGKRDEVIQRGGDQRFLDRHFNRLADSSFIAMTYGLESANRGIEPGHVLSKRSTRLHRRTIHFA